MSVHSLSNLAVQELSDESAAIHGGGVGFQGFDGLNGAGVASPTQVFSNNATGLLGNFAFTGSLAFANNKLESFRASSVPSGKRYRVSFFDNTNFTGLLGTLTFTSNSTQNLASGLRNKAGSVRIQTF